MADQCAFCEKTGTHPLDKGEKSTLHHVTLTLNEYHAKQYGQPTRTFLVCRDEEACKRRQWKAEDARERMFNEARKDKD